MQFYLCWPGSLLAIVTTILINMCFSFMYLDGVFECCKVSVDVRGVDGDFSKAACGASFSFRWHYAVCALGTPVHGMSVVVFLPIIPALGVARLLVTVRVFCLLKTASKSTRTYHFWDKKMIFFLGRGPTHSTTPHLLRCLAPSLLKS